MTSQIAALLTALQTCTSSGLAGGTTPQQDLRQGLLATSSDGSAEGGDRNGRRKEKREDHPSVSLPDEFGLDSGLDQRHL